jgi:hypothetical protein
MAAEDLVEYSSDPVARSAQRQSSNTNALRYGIARPQPGDDDLLL